MVKKKETHVTKVMKSKGAAPFTATLVGTASTALVAWVVETWLKVPVPAFIQAYAASLVSVAAWFLMPVEWETK